jgi:FixJ family two-component response regulator
LKILFMTGYAETRLLDAPLPRGAEMIHKPFNLDVLTDTVAAMLAA